MVVRSVMETLIEVELDKSVLLLSLELLALVVLVLEAWCVDVTWLVPTLLLRPTLVVSDVLLALPVMLLLLLADVELEPLLVMEEDERKLLLLSVSL